MSLFAGVRFALLGFDPVSDAQYRSEMALHGGADSGGAQEGCTHLVVSGLVYDDPACVAARKDGTKVVTALWVDDCLDLGAMADADHVLYRPVRDLEGIPGAESLCICLTGYQRQNGRESIMKMVNMMGARFSKPLTAKRVTHLICYKFEGEKYELAKAVKINTINHQWLDDCLNAWDILPVDNYTARSGWELEIMEAEAKDSEDEAESADGGLFDSRGIARIIPAMEIAMRTAADLDGHIPNHGPSVFSGNAEVPAGTHVGTSQQIREVKDASEWSVDVTVDTLSTPNTKFVTVSANPDGHTPIHGPTVFTGNADAVVPAGRRLETSQQIREAEEVSKMSLDVRADRLSTPNTNVVTIPADPDAHAHASQVDKVRADRLSTPNTNVVTISADPDAHAHASQVDKVRDDRLSTPNTNVVTISADPDAHAHASQVDKVRADRLCTPNTNVVTISADPDAHAHASQVDKVRDDRLSTPNTNVVTISADPDAHAHASQVDKVRADRLSTPNTNVVTISADPDAHAHASQVDKVEVEAADSEHDKLVFHATFEAGPKEIPITAVPGEYEIFPQKVSTSSARNPGAKRSRTPEDETAAISVHVNCDFAASKSKHDKVLSNGSVEADLEKNCSLNTAESTTILPGEISSRARNAVAKSPLNANSEMNDAIVVYKTANVNMEENPTTGARPTAGKTKRVSFDLSFHEAVNAEGSTSKVSSSASADNPETCSPIRVLKPRRKAVAKRRRASSSKEGRSGSEACRTVSALSEASKFPAESSTNAGKVTLYKGLRNSNADEACEDRPEDLPSSKPRSSKRQKTDHNNKENIPANASLAPKPKHGRKRLSSECVRIAVENNEDAPDDRGMTGGNDDGSSAVLEPEPTWFMLSGNRLLRKQCRSILLRLKGRVCSHSHHWSFQATHFITPELRRTEKFFAAAAAGRWILKPEYVFACEEAGKLVAAEPFEWHGDGLNDNHTISLDAPRKWRHLKQRTGHGAFYGMRIIIYGECISPSRDTLRRAVRAGDGTVLATAPPYTRFLRPGAISFAVVAAGTPSSSAWVQEFKSHGIPCVSPSYLVDLVCKPGHLELHKHVLFGMQDLADESLRKLPPSAHREQEGGDAEQSCAMVVVHESEGPISCVAADAAEIASA